MLAVLITAARGGSPGTDSEAHAPPVPTPAPAIPHRSPGKNGPATVSQEAADSARGAITRPYVSGPQATPSHAQLGNSAGSWDSAQPLP